MSLCPMDPWEPSSSVALAPELSLQGQARRKSHSVGTEETGNLESKRKAAQDKPGHREAREAFIWMHQMLAFCASTP